MTLLPWHALRLAMDIRFSARRAVAGIETFSAGRYTAAFPCGPSRPDHG
jgi:hypothetical protein